VDDAPKDIPAFNVVGSDSDVGGVTGDRHGQVIASVWALFVVMTHVRPQNALCVATTDEQEAIETLASHRAHPALGVGVGSRSLHRGADYLDALGGEPRRS